MSGRESPQPNSSSDWQPCQGGEIASLQQRLEATRRTQRRQRVAGAVTAAALLVTVGLFGWNQMTDQHDLDAKYGRISCRRVLELDQQYVTHELDPELQQRIEIHLAACSSCHDHMEALARELGTAISQWLTWPARSLHWS